MAHVELSFLTAWVREFARVIGESAQHLTDLDAAIALRSAGLDLSSVVPDGDVVPVKTSVSDNGLRDNEVVKSLACAFITAPDDEDTG